MHALPKKIFLSEKLQQKEKGISWLQFYVLYMMQLLCVCVCIYNIYISFFKTYCTFCKWVP